MVYSGFLVHGSSFFASSSFKVHTFLPPMPDFAYIARDSAGLKVSGVIAAGNQREALGLLTKQALFPISVADKAPAPKIASIRRIKPDLLATTYSQLADLLRSGVPLLRSINILREQSSSDRLTFVLGEIHDAVEQGSTLAEAMGQFPRVFGEMTISMVRAGGEGAFLEDALERVAEFTERQQDMKGRTLGAMLYPIILATVGFSVVTVIIVFFVPMFKDLFQKLQERGELPWATTALLATSDFVKAWGWLVAIAAIAGVYALKKHLDTPTGRQQKDRLFLSTPKLGAIVQSLAVSRFCRVLGTLLRNGVPILKALEISGKATGNSVLSRAVDEAAANITEGQSLAKPLAASGHFPRNVVEMIAVAEESNTLENVLVDISDRLDKKTWRQLDMAVRLLEPLMLVLIAGMVALVAVALILPMLKMSSTL